jgi:hypothetical protein
MTDNSDVNATLPETVVTAKRDPPPPSALWMRRWDLVIATDSGEKTEADATSLANFHIQFDVNLACMQTFQTAHMVVHNPPPELLVKDVLQQYSSVSLYGGYEKARYGELFSGTITYFKKGKSSPVDTVLEIFAATKDQIYNWTPVNHALPAGSTGEDVINAVLAVMAPYGVTKGQITALAKNMPADPRGRTLYGMPMDILRDLSQTLDARCFIDGGKLYMLGPGEQLSTSDIELNIGNGLINIPSQEIGQGLHVQCLLHYQIRPGMTIRINNKDIIKQVQKSDGSSVSPDADTVAELSATAPVEDDGKYGVYSVHHHGDNRGQPWYTDIVTNPIVPPGGGG